MRPRITRKHLEQRALLINEMTQSPTEAYTVLRPGHIKANPGCFYISGAYGGWALERMSAGGGSSDVFNSGHVPARELYDQMHAFVVALRMVKHRDVNLGVKW